MQLTPEQARHMLRIFQFYLRESTHVLSDPRNFPPDTVDFARSVVKQAQGK